MKTRIAALLVLASMGAGTAWVFAQGFGESYDVPLDETAAEAVAYHSALSASTLTDEYISEVMEWERPHTEDKSPNACEIISVTSRKRYELTGEERSEVERVVMAEAGGESREGIIAVAQCILNAAEREGIRPTEAVKKYGYTPIRKEPSEAVREAVAAVFDSGETVTDEPILYFYADYIRSGWHESQRFVMQIGVHRFFAAKEGASK